MQVDLGESERAFQAALRRFAREEVGPRAKAWDEGREVEPEVSRAYAELGAPGLRIPQEYGGSPASFVMLGIAIEETARGDYGFAENASRPAIFGEFFNLASPELCREWLPRIASLESIGLFALTEPGGGSDAANIRTHAVRDGDDWVLTGEKASISNAGNADVGLVFARTGEPGARGISCFLVPMGLPGVSRQVYDSPGGRLVQRGSVTLDQVRVPAYNLVGDENQGFYQAMRFFDYNRAIVALQSLGAAQECIEETITYVKSRTTFGRPLAKYEGVSFQLAEFITMTEAARLLCYQALSKKDRGEPCGKETAMAKWFGTSTAFQVIHGCLLLHGHYGYNKDLPFERRLRDVMGAETADGTIEIMKLIIARETIGQVAVPYR